MGGEINAAPNNPYLGFKIDLNSTCVVDKGEGGMYGGFNSFLGI
jgi:hypothetical protein